MDSDHYPTEEELERIRTWDLISEIPERAAKFAECFDWIGANCWEYADIDYFQKDGNVYRLHTGGWSGNEDVIAAMRQNFILWSMTWVATRRGGHYLFEVERDAAEGLYP